VIRSTVLVLLFSAAASLPALGASKLSIAALGDGAPGGGVFAGPSFVGEPSAAGTGWVAFRAQIEGKTTEQIVVRNMLTGASSAAASIGDVISKDIGKFKQFLGKPSVNAHGDVAFAALVTPPDGTPVNLALPPPGGIFLYSQGNLTVIATPSVDTGAGVLDLTTPINIGVSDAIDIAERTPALNDNGDVAFVASTVSNTTGTTPSLGSAMFRRRAGQNLETVFKHDDQNPGSDGGKFDVLGPPALNNAGTLAFHATLSGLSAPLDGVFTFDGATVTRLIRDGAIINGIIQPIPFQIPGFDDVVVLNDQGDVACTGGPPVDLSNTVTLNVDLDSSGVILIPHGGTPLLVGYPGQSLKQGDSTVVVWSINLGPDAGSRVAPPSFSPAGQVVFFAQVANGGSQQILRADTQAATVQNLVSVGGSGATATTPAGGTYLSADSAPAVDATGALAFTARIENAPTTSEAFIYMPIPQTSGTAQAIRIGDPAENTQGIFGGPAFSTPEMNDSGDVIFRSFVARGLSSLGIFKYSQGKTDSVVRVGDPAAVPSGLTCDTATFTNLLGNPSINTNGDVAFAATVSCCAGGKCANQGRGLFVLRGGTMQALALPNLDITLQSPPPDKVRESPSFRTLGTNPALDDSGAVAFRATLQYQNPFDPFSSLKENGVYLIDNAGIHLLAWQGQDSGAGAPFFSFADPTISNGSVVVRSVLGTNSDGPKGFFIVDGSSPRPIAVEGTTVDGMAFTALRGRALSDAAGEVIFPAMLGNDPGVTVLRWATNAFQPIAGVGDTGPQGGIIRSIGPPSVARTGSVAFRMSFQPLTGGVSGLFLASAGPLLPFLRIGEGGGDGVDGRITGINQNIAFNSHDQTSFLASIGGGSSRSAILLATPATLSVGRLAFKRGPGTLLQNTSGKKKDQIQFTAVLKPGQLPRAATDKKTKLRRVALTVAVGDMKGNLWSANVPSTAVKVRGRTLVAKGGTDSKSLQSLRVQVAKDGSMRVAARSARINLSDPGNASAGHNFDGTGAVILAPPFNVRVDVGGEGGNVLVNCTPKPRRFRCGH
jgi:hypothetical protein